MAKKKNTDDIPTVTGTLKNGTKVTVSEDLASRLRGFTADTSKKGSSSSTSSS